VQHPSTTLTAVYVHVADPFSMAHDGDAGVLLKGRDGRKGEEGEDGRERSGRAGQGEEGGEGVK
jgi:hypothetical protein